MSVVIDYLRPNSACFEDPPQKSKDKCEVNGKFHVEEQKYFLTFVRTPAGFAYAADNSSSTLAYLSANGFDLLKPEVKSRILYAVTLSSLWMRDYADFKKTHKKSPDFSEDVEASIQLVNLGNFSTPDASEKTNIANWVEMILRADSDKMDFLQNHLNYPVGHRRSHLLTPVILSRIAVMQGILLVGQRASEHLGSLPKTHPLYAKSREVLKNVATYVYWGEPSFKNLLDNIKGFSRELYQAKDVSVLNFAEPGKTLPLDLPLPNSLDPEKMLDPVRYNFFQVLGKILELPGEDSTLHVEGEEKNRLGLLLKWLKNDHVADLKKTNESVSVPPPSSELFITDLPPLPLEPEEVHPKVETPLVLKPVGEKDDEKAPVNLFPNLKQEKPEAPNHAFVAPVLTEDQKPVKSPLWIPLSEGGLCAAGAVLTTVGALQKTVPGEKNPIFISGTTSVGAGCLSLLMHFVSPKAWSPYVAEGVSGGGGAALGFLIPWFLTPPPNPRDKEPVSVLDNSGRNPTRPFGP